MGRSVEIILALHSAGLWPLGRAQDPQDLRQGGRISGTQEKHDYLSRTIWPFRRRSVGWMNIVKIICVLGTLCVFVCVSQCVFHCLSQVECFSVSEPLHAFVSFFLKMELRNRRLFIRLLFLGVVTLVVSWIHQIKAKLGQKPAWWMCLQGRYVGGGIKGRSDEQ